MSRQKIDGPMFVREGSPRSRHQNQIKDARDILRGMLVNDQEEEARDSRGHFQTMMQLWYLCRNEDPLDYRAVLMKVWLDQWSVLTPRPPERWNAYLAGMVLQEFALSAQSVAACSPGAARHQAWVDREGQWLGRSFNYAPLNRRTEWYVFMATTPWTEDISPEEASEI